MAHEGRTDKASNRLEKARSSLRVALVERRPLTNDEAAVYLGMAPKTLEKRRCQGIDCPPYHQGVRYGAVRFIVEELDEYQRGRVVESTSRW